MNQQTPDRARRKRALADSARWRVGIRIKWTTVTLDCTDAEALGLFYAVLFGWEINDRDGAGWVQVRVAHGGVGLNFQANNSYEPPRCPEQHGQQAKMMSSVTAHLHQEDTMGFVQVIQFRTSKIDEMRKIGDEWEAAAGADRKARRIVMCEDRDNKGQYFNIVFFDSYEAAMENSNLPITQELSQKMMALGDGPPTFYNLDVIDERS